MINKSCADLLFNLCRITSAFFSADLTCNLSCYVFKIILQESSLQMWSVYWHKEWVHRHAFARTWRTNLHESRAPNLDLLFTMMTNTHLRPHGHARNFVAVNLIFLTNQRRQQSWRQWKREGHCISEVLKASMATAVHAVSMNLPSISLTSLGDTTSLNFDQ